MSQIEEHLAWMLSAAGISYSREYRACPERRWRWDFYIPPNILCECQGGIWRGGRHTTGKGYRADCEKLNWATVNGFRTLYLTGDMVESGEAIRVIEMALGTEATAE